MALVLPIAASGAAVAAVARASLDPSRACPHEALAAMGSTSAIQARPRRRTVISLAG
ncbi:MAG: hypothetical protein HOO96_42015 [Polyangiaceae bacterium]|nr:hypothetical protein [Polyangiaceae bacterium]